MYTRGEFRNTTWMWMDGVNLQRVFRQNIVDDIIGGYSLHVYSLKLSWADAKNSADYS